MPLIPLANCLVQSTSFPHASIRVIRSIRAICDTSSRSSCCRFPSRSLRLCERQKPFSPPFSLCSLKTRSQLSASNVPSSAFTVPRLVSPSLREAPYSLPFLRLPTRNSEEPFLFPLQDFGFFSSPGFLKRKAAGRRAAVTTHQREIRTQIKRSAPPWYRRSRSANDSSLLSDPFTDLPSQQGECSHSRCESRGNHRHSHRTDRSQ